MAKPGRGKSSTKGAARKGALDASDRVFLDTNVFVYLLDRHDATKQQRAREVIERVVAEGRAVVSTQVLQEFYSAVTTKLRVDKAEAEANVRRIAALDVVQVDVPAILAAIQLHRASSLSLWDALILTSARMSGCAWILTEDLQDGRDYDGVVVHNPFAP